MDHQFEYVVNQAVSVITEVRLEAFQVLADKASEHMDAVAASQSDVGATEAMTRAIRDRLMPAVDGLLDHPGLAALEDMGAVNLELIAHQAAASVVREYEEFVMDLEWAAEKMNTSGDLVAQTHSAVERLCGRRATDAEVRHVRGLIELWDYPAK